MSPRQLDRRRTRRRRLAGSSLWPWTIAAGLAVLALSFHPMRCSDLWWHLAAGRWIVAHGALPKLDPFSFTAAGPWNNHEWLADVVFDRWTAAFGVRSLVYWYWGVLLATYLLLFDLLRRRGASGWLSLGACTLAAAASVPFFEIRPHLYSLLLFVILLRLTLGRAQLPKALPLLFAIWANLHASFVFGLLALATIVGSGMAPTLLLHFRERSRDESGSELGAVRHDLGVTLACAAATILNPLGWRVFVLPLTVAFARHSSFNALVEWLPPFQAGAVQAPLFGWLIALAILALADAIGSRRPGRAPASERWAVAACTLLTLAMALRAARFIPLFAIATAALAALACGHRQRSDVGQRDRADRNPWLRELAPPALAIVIAGGALLRFPLGKQAFRHLTSLESFPVDTLDFVTANHLSGRVLTFYGWGGYVDYRTHARLKVFIDSRANTVFSSPTFDDYRRVQYMAPGWQEVVERSGADYFLWLNLATPQVRRVDQAARLLASGRWRKLHEDFVSVLLVRRTVVLDGPLRSPASAYRELALGGLAMRRGDAAGAESFLRAALRLDPGLLAACRNLALTVAYRGEEAEAWRTHRRCERIFPESQSAVLLRESLAARAARAAGPGDAPQRRGSAGPRSRSWRSPSLSGRRGPAGSSPQPPSAAPAASR